MRYKDRIANQLPTLAEELRQEAIKSHLHPERGAFILALQARDKSDFRVNSKPWLHYDAIVKWMINNWPEQLG